MSEGQHPSRGWEQTVTLFRQNALVQTLGIEMVEANAVGIKLTMQTSKQATQPYDVIESGTILAFAQIAAGMHACWDIDLAKQRPVSMEVSGTQLGGAGQTSLRAEGCVIRRGRNFIVHQIDVYKKDGDTQIYTARVTNYLEPVSG